MSQNTDVTPKTKIRKIKKQGRYLFTNDSMMSWMLYYLSKIKMPMPLTPLEIEDKNLAIYVVAGLKKIILDAEALIDNINNKLKSES